jgi:hypothetical protein
MTAVTVRATFFSRNTPHPYYLDDMKRAAAIIIPLLLASLASPASAQSMKSKELLGLRLGGVVSTDDLDRYFGKGSELEIHFIEGLGSWFGIGMSLSMHNFGRSLDPEANIRFLGEDRVIKLEIYSLTVQMVTRIPVSGRFSVGTETGAGLYTINAVVPSGYWEGTITKNRFGVNAGACVLYRLTPGGLALEAALKFHHIFGGEDDDLVTYAFTGDKTTDYYQATVGVMLFTW